MSPITSPDDVIAALAQGESGWAALEGLPESDWLEFKGEPYRLQEPYGRLALAQDTACFANAGGGVLVIGVRTERDSNTNADIASEIRPIDFGLLDLQSMQDIIAQYVHPLPTGLTLRRWPDAAGHKGLASIHVPAQDSAAKYFLVATGQDEDGRPLANHVGLFIRTGAHCRALGTETVYELIREGRRAREAPSLAGNEVVALIEQLIRSAAQPVGQDPGPTAEDAEMQIGIDEAVAQLDQDSVLIAQAWPARRFDLSSIQSRGPEGIRTRFERPPVSHRAGFDLDFAIDSRVLPGGGLQKSFDGNAAMSLLPSGLTTLIVGSRYLGWGMERQWGRPDATINPTALVEFVTEFFRFYANVIVDALGGEDSLTHQRVGLRRMAPDRLNKMISGLPDIFSETHTLEGRDHAEATLEADGHEFPANAFRLLSQIYREFGWGPEDIPYSTGDSINVDALISR